MRVITIREEPSYGEVSKFRCPVFHFSLLVISSAKPTATNTAIILIGA